ncbi:hypothetical protein KUH03_38050 [Sphingobacterium sp. E70]|uniref:hypothetical protein n=1 Tax=Sphingobacterium sp. E70 TaxID=2853439 RepID=UPI00211C0CF2|nr:hypothetical protein [Sphingobacterium sp. E70]ULT24673.1 hypothetical protein KUH03_38050 [Sphingobacterium sp. E70]
MDRQFSGLKDYVLVYQAEVINQTGEMQMASGGYTYSSRPWQLQIQVPNLMEEKKWRDVTILKQNQNGFPLKFSGKVNIYKLEQASLPLTDEYRGSFGRAEYHLLSKDLYSKYFPLYFDPASLEKEEKKLKLLAMILITQIQARSYWTHYSLIGDDIRSKPSVYRKGIRCALLATLVYIGREIRN